MLDTLPKETAKPSSEAIRQWPGHPDPLGATGDGQGVKIAVFSEHATSVELCLFDSASKQT